MEPRRRSPRVPIRGWNGRCAVLDDPEPQWAECQVVDISLIGAGLDIWSDSDDDLTGCRLAFEVWPPHGESMVFRLTGRVNRVSRESAFHRRVGLEFENLSQIEEIILRVIEEAQSILVA